MTDVMLQNCMLGNILECEEGADPWPSNAGRKKNNSERFSLFQDYLGLSNLLNTVKISDDNPLLYSSQKNIAFLQRARRSSWGSDGSDNAAVLSPTMENQYSYEKNFIEGMNSQNIPPPPGMRLPKAIREHINGAYHQENKSDKFNLPIPHPHPPSPPAQPPTPGLNIPPSQIAARTSNQQQSVQVCVFCRNNGESESVYTSHVLKDAEGRTSCPILRAYTCPICKANGDNSHTIKYCPLNQNARLLMNQHGNNNQQQMGFGPRNQLPMPPRANGFRPPFPPQPLHHQPRFNHHNGKSRT